MKGSRNSNNKQSKQDFVHVPKPEIRDDLDSRKEKEIGFKADKKTRKKSGRKK